jgi:hypothetical protein
MIRKGSRLPARPDPGWRTTALVAAALALFVNAAVTVGSSYLARRDQHVQDADKCNRAAANLISTTAFASDAVKAAASTLGEPISAGSSSKSFTIPPIDEILRSQDQYLDVVDVNSSNIVIQLETYYRTVKDNLLHSNDIKAEGHTFSLLPNSRNQTAYLNLLNGLVIEADVARNSLEKSSYCDDLAITPLLSSEPRPRPHLRSNPSLEERAPSTR